MSGWTTCCRGRKSACPEIKIDADDVYIRDDYGAIVRMSISQFDVVVQKVRELVNQDSDPHSGLYFPDYLPE